MPRIKIISSDTLSCASKFDSNLRQLNDIASQISSTASSLGWSVKSKSNIDSSIQNAINASKILSSELSSLSSYIKNATSRLVEADKSGEKGITDRIKKYSKAETIIYQATYANKIADKEPVIKNPGDYYFEDTNGEDIVGAIYLNDEHFGVGDLQVGHAAIILKKSDGSGIYYSYGIKASDHDTLIEDVKVFIGQDYPGVLNRRDLSPEEMENFVKGGSGSITFHEGVEPASNYSYSGHISIQVTEEQGKLMFERAQGIFNNDKKTYNLYTDNCNHFTQGVLESANLSISDATIPNAAYDRGVEKIDQGKFPKGSFYGNYQSNY